VGAVTSSGLDLITGALRNLGVQAAGEPVDATDGNDALQVLNDLLESLSTDKDFVYSTNYNKLAWNPGQTDYTMGNPVFGTFSGNTQAGSPFITNVTASLNLTTGMASNGLIVGGTITDTNFAIPAGTTIIAGSANTGTITLSQNATLTLGIGNADFFTYTAPGNFAIPRPLRIRSGYTRITASGNTGLDYWFDVCSFDDYNEIGYKGVPGPWPYVVSVRPDFPYAHLFVYPNPQQAGEVHFYTDVILADLQSTTSTFSLPQGYSRAIKKLLAIELAPEYGKTPSPELLRQAWEARQFIKALNASPVKKLRFDSALMAGNGKDASFIMHGGFGSNL
jgi:hypothetical protein